MVEHYDFDNDGNRLAGPDGIYVLASEYEKLEAALAWARKCIEHSAGTDPMNWYWPDGVPPWKLDGRPFESDIDAL